MRNQRIRAAKKKRVPRKLNPNDFISRIPDDVLVMILYLLPIKDAVVTSLLSRRWRCLWCNLTLLNFDATQSLHKTFNNPKLCVSEQAKYVKQVHGVIKRYKHPIVHDFRIPFDLGAIHYEDINEWIRFAVNKKVEILEIDLRDNRDKIHETYRGYDFPCQLSDRDVSHLFERESINVAVVEILFLKKLYLKKVNVSDAILKELLTNSPNLETLSIHDSAHFSYIDVGGGSLKLKYFEITYCHHVEYVDIYDFDLVSFTYKGPKIELNLTNLPKLKELDIGGGDWLGNDVLNSDDDDDDPKELDVGGVARLGNDVFSRMSLCLSYLQVLSFNVDHPEESLKFDLIPELPNVKKLKLTIGARKDNSLLEFTNLAKACPSLETFTIELLWVSPINKNRTMIRHVASHPHEHLKILEIFGYYARTSDLELVVYVIDNTVGLKKIVIDPNRHVRKRTAVIKDVFNTEEMARFFAKRQLELLTPPEVELIML